MGPQGPASTTQAEKSFFNYVFEENNESQGNPPGPFPAPEFWMTVAPGTNLNPAFTSPIPTLDADLYIIAPRAGTLSNLSAYRAGVGTENVTIFVATMAGGYIFAPTALTVTTVSGSVVTDSVDTVAVSAGDLIALQIHAGPSQPKFNHNINCVVAFS